MTLTQQEHQALETLEMFIKNSNSLESAVNNLRIMLNDDVLVDKVVDERALILERRRKEAEAITVHDPETGSDPWYMGPSDSDIFWPSLKNKLESDPGWKAAVPSLDKTSTDVVSLLANPNSETIATRGLVLGYVQSGKTANFTATIAKAADAGYRLFIVLSGVHNSLRRQTQLRLEDQLCDLQPTQWVPMTDEFNDFGNPVKALPLVAGSQLRLLAVVKKNVSRLTNLRNWLLDAHAKGGLDKCPVLIIDDEADQASPNAAKDAELDQTAINGLLRDLLALPRVAYVGYTATPFANVLANPADPKDLYPRDFIYSLPKPTGYFGSEELFGAPVPEPEASQSDEGHDMIRYVPEDEAGTYKPTAKNPTVPAVTASLADAIRWFLMATAARRLRSGETKHSSMLIHTTMRIEPQNALVPVIKAHLKKLRQELSAGRVGAWREQWEEEISREPASRHGSSSPAFSAVVGLLPEVLSATKVVADNSASPERLLYATDPATVIAVGGNTLSRGLTLEGLISSFFLRTAGAYDSALQMGRWFGYRRGYEDLPRIWTTERLREDFQFLAEIENALRAEIKRYAGGMVTPRDVAVRVQLHPRMQVTSPLKMQFAIKASASFSELHPQTTYFEHLNSDVLTKNLLATRRLLSAAAKASETATSDSGSGSGSGSGLRFHGVPLSTVQEFLTAYSFHEKSEMSGGMLTDYVRTQADFGMLKEWNVAVVTKAGAESEEGSVDLGLKQRINLLTRSQLKNSEPGSANIGTLMSRPDRVIDFEVSASMLKDMGDNELQDLRNESGRPLLLIYPIDKNSSPRPSLKSRKDLGAAEHLIGVAIVFPRAAEGSDPSDSISVGLPQPDEESEGPEAPYVDAEGSQNEVTL